MSKEKKLLLHICCAPCSTYVIEKLCETYDLSGYFYNPNLYPHNEHDRRLREAQKYFEKIGKKLYSKNRYEKKEWLNFIKGLEQEPEGGKRCLKCYLFRLEKTARQAKELGFDYYSTTLTISPHKKAEDINPIGKALAQKYQLKFLNEDYKKQDGFRHSVDLSKKHGLYRQNYCGCEFSIRG